MDEQTLEALAEDYNIPVQEIFNLVENIKLPEDITQEDVPNYEKQQEETSGKVRKCEFYEMRKDHDDNSKKQIVLCWYYE